MTMMDIYFSFNVRFCYTSYTLQNKFIHFAYKVSEHELSLSSAPTRLLVAPPPPLNAEAAEAAEHPGPTIQQNIRMHLIISELCTWILNFL